MAQTPSVLNSILATASSIFLPPLGLEGFVFLKPYGPKLNKTARNLAIAKLVFFLVAAGLVVVIFTTAKKATVDGDKDKKKDTKDTKDYMKSFKNATGKEMGMFAALSIASGVFGLLTLVSTIVCLVSFSKVKKAI